MSAPEVIALARWLKERLTDAELAELIENVTLCDEWIGNGATAAPCALQGDDHVCMAYGAQPFGCRPTLAARLLDQLRDETGVPAGARMLGDVHTRTVSAGVQEGLREGLEHAGLDAATYELHSALRRALSRPGAAEAWARGGGRLRRVPGDSRGPLSVSGLAFEGPYELSPASRRSASSFASMRERTTPKRGSCRTPSNAGCCSTRAG